MFFWLSALIGLLIFPFTLICGYPIRVTTARAYLTPEISKAFPVASLTPIVLIKRWPWFVRHMAPDENGNGGIRGYAFSIFIALRDDAPRSTEVHEAIHVIHQSAVSPPLYLLVYVLDWLVFLPFRKFYRPGYYRRAPVAEHIAYELTKDV